MTPSNRMLAADGLHAMLHTEDNKQLHTASAVATQALPDGSKVVLGASWMVGQDLRICAAPQRCSEKSLEELLFDIDNSRLGLTPRPAALHVC